MLGATSHTSSVVDATARENTQLYCWQQRRVRSATNAVLNLPSTASTRSGCIDVDQKQKMFCMKLNYLYRTQIMHLECITLHHLFQACAHRLSVCAAVYYTKALRPCLRSHCGQVMQKPREDGRIRCPIMHHSSHRTDVHRSTSMRSLTFAVSVQTECKAEGEERVLLSVGTLGIPIQTLLIDAKAADASALQTRGRGGS